MSSRRTIRRCPRQSRTTSLMEPIGALPGAVGDANSLKNMVGPCGLEPQTSTVSKKLFAVSINTTTQSLLT